MKNWKWFLFTVFVLSIFISYKHFPSYKQETYSQDMKSLAPVPFVGIFYFLWHCPVSTSKNYNPSQIIPNSGLASKGIQPWAEIPSFHWWGKPAEDYYCLAENKTVLVKHAELLKAAGIDFIFVDSSNWTDRNKDSTEAMVVEPFEKLMEVWSEIPGAPKVVPFVPINGTGTLATYFDKMLNRYPKLAFQFKGKPLFLAVRHLSKPTSQQYLDIQSRYTLRSMWGLLGQSELAAGSWSFLQPCQKEFLGSKANLECLQDVTTVNGEVEQTSVSMAYQETYMSNYVTATPKYFGKTFLRQMETAFKSESQIITITSWNEWIAQRFCPDGGLKCAVDHFQNENKVFVDQYTYEYNRDIEPSVGEGTYYYELMKRSVALIKTGINPMKASDMIKTSKMQGSIDALQLNKDGSYSVLGWACAEGLNDSVEVQLYAGGIIGKGTLLVKQPTQITSEPAIGLLCKTKSQKHRFQISISAKVAEKFGGNTIYIYGISPYGYENIILKRSGEVKFPNKK